MTLVTTMEKTNEEKKGEVIKVRIVMMMMVVVVLEE